MAKITLNPISGSYASATAVNNRLAQIEEALNDNVLWRAGFVSEDNVMNNELDMNGYSIINVGEFASTNLYLGAYAVAPTFFSPGVPLDATHTGVLYFNTTDNSMYVWTGTVWSSLSSAATTAASVSITDTANNYTGTSVEDALAELGNSTGAGIVQIADAGGYFTSTNVEGALAELYTTGAQKSTDNITVSTPTAGQQTFTGVPTWANKITLQFEDLIFATDAFPWLVRVFTTTGTVRYQGVCMDASGVIIASNQTYNYIKLSNGKGGSPSPWGGTVTLQRHGTYNWTASVSISQQRRAGTGAGNQDVAIGAVTLVDMSDHISTIEFGSFGTIDECNVTVTYEA